MPLFLVERTDEVGWDEFDSFVIRANSRKQAISEAKLHQPKAANNRNTRWRTSVIKEEGPVMIIHESFCSG